MIEKTKQIHLSALNLDLNIPECISYQDLGFVDNVKAYANFLKWKRTKDMRSLFERENEGIKHIGNIRMIEKRNNQYEFSIFYTHNDNPAKELLTRAHEETHFVHAVKCLDSLTDAAKLSTGINIDFKYVKEKIQSTEDRMEIIADIGGLYAIHRMYGSETVMNYLDNNCIYTERAKQFYIKFLKNSITQKE